MENPEVARIFDEVADLLEIQGANPFRIRAYRNAARTIRDLSESLADILADPGRKLTQLPGIGDDLAAKIATIVESGDLPLRQELRAQVPAGLPELLRVPGLGPKRVALLHEKLRISSVEDLRGAAEAGRLRDLAGFGEKTEQNVLRALTHLEEVGRRTYLAEARVYADAIVRHLHDGGVVDQIEVAGSFRRRRDTVGDLDVLVTCSQAKRAMDRLAQYSGIAEVLARGETKMTVRLKVGLQMDLRVVPPESYGAALQYFTGSKAHNIRLRRLAQERGLKLSEYGLFKGERQVAGRTEEDVYRAVGLPWIPPELREDRGEIERAADGKLPVLVEVDDLRGDLHTHTNVTDGRASLEEMVAAAKRLGRRYIAVTDHSKRVTMAHGLDAKRLRAQWAGIDRLAQSTKGISILKGIEVDILDDGRLDLPDDVLRDADYVVASVHYNQKQPRDKMTRRIIRAIENPNVSAIGHPTGRLIGRREPYEVDLDAVIQAAADNGCLMEINAQPSRLDLDDVAARAAKDKGVRLVISTDAHAVEELQFLEFGVFQARRAWLEAADIANTLTWPQLRKQIRPRHHT